MFSTQPMVIVVEDNPADAQITKEVLSELDANLKLVHCADGEGLLRLLPVSNIEDIRFIILDLGLPGLHGKEVLRRLAGHPTWKNLPVIVFSSTENMEDILECYHLGSNAFVRKPCTYEEFEHVVGSMHRFWSGANLTPAMGQ